MFRRLDKRLRGAVWILGLLLALALGRDLIANDRPLACRIEGRTFFPGLRSVWAAPERAYGHPLLDSLRANERWKTAQYEWAVFAPVPFSQDEFTRHPLFALQPPGSLHPGLNGRFRHWLGTDDQGRDVAATLVAGARQAVVAGLTAMGVAFALGMALGALAGYFGDERLRLRRGPLLGLLAALPLALLCVFILIEVYSLGGGSRPAALAGLALAIGLPLAGYQAGRLLEFRPWFRQAVAVPADLAIMRLAEVFNAMPRLVVVITLAILLRRQSQVLMIALIGVLSWTGVARFVRAELLRVRELEFITAARGMGFSEWRTLLRHALPNALRPALIALAFGIGNAVILVASLSFLGYGAAEPAAASWGRLLHSARGHAAAWWLAIPPGLAICLTVLAVNTVGEWLAGDVRGER
jgi:peptide/nickel transport system permease protein